MEEMHPVHESSEHLASRPLAGPDPGLGLRWFPNLPRIPADGAGRYPPGGDERRPVLPDPLIGMYYTG